MNISDIQFQGSFIESVLLLVTLRLIWCQWLSPDLVKARSYPFSYYIFVKKELESDFITGKIAQIKTRTDSNLSESISDDIRCQDLILRYNILHSRSRIPMFFGVLAILAVLAYIRPFALLSLLICDLVVARIDHLIVTTL